MQGGPGGPRSGGPCPAWVPVIMLKVTCKTTLKNYVCVCGETAGHPLYPRCMDVAGSDAAEVEVRRRMGAAQAAVRSSGLTE